MPAPGGTHWTRRTALLLTAGAVAAGLAGCEYADDVGPSPAAAGPSGDTSSGGFSVSSKVVRAGRYEVSAACVGAPDAHLSVFQGAREGGTLLVRSLDCGIATGALLDLESGEVSAHLVRYGGGAPGPATGAVAGIRISFYGQGR